jgi:hypothetical protein
VDEIARTASLEFGVKKEGYYTVLWVFSGSVVIDGAL